MTHKPPLSDMNGRQGFLCVTGGACLRLARRSHRRCHPWTPAGVEPSPSAGSLTVNAPGSIFFSPFWREA